MNKDRVEALLNKGVMEGVYPGAVLLVAFKGEILLFQHVVIIKLKGSKGQRGKK